MTLTRRSRRWRVVAETLEAQGLDVQAADSPGHKPPAEVLRWPWSREWFRPDVVARRGHRRVYGYAKRDALGVRGSTQQFQASSLLGSRILVICVPEGELPETANVLAGVWGLRNLTPLFLLGDESSQLRTPADVLRVQAWR